MNNMPEVKIGVVAVSRDCFPESLSVSRREALMKAYKEKYGEKHIYECPICIVESETIWYRLWKILRKPDVMHWLYILETSDRRSQRRFLQNTSMDQRCSLQQQKRAAIT